MCACKDDRAKVPQLHFITAEYQDNTHMHHKAQEISKFFSIMFPISIAKLERSFAVGKSLKKTYCL